MISVALVGPDGAGKSTVSRMLQDQQLPAPMRTIYLGVNLEASRLMLPTTRLALAVKRARGRRPDMTAGSPTATAVRGGEAVRPGGAAMTGRAVRMALWLAEEWFRQLVALTHRLRGRIVVFDRHFFADYYHYDVAPAGRRPASARVHGFLLRNVYPKPDLVICLDAPGEVLYGRKHEATAEWLELRRNQYLQLASVVPHFAVVDVDRPVGEVARDVAVLISDFCKERRS